MKDKRKTVTGWTRDERLSQKYRQALFLQVLVQRMLKDGQTPDEVRRRAGATPEEIDRRVLELREALG